jgi:hypothetical protein
VREREREPPRLKGAEIPHAGADFAKFQHDMLSLMRWEDKLQGQKFQVLTNHHSLKWLKTQRGLSCCQVQRLEYLGQFDFDIAYIVGNDNMVTDALLQRYKSDTLEDNWAPMSL